MKKIVVIFSFLFVSGCFEATKEIVKENRVNLGDIKINYYSNKSVTSLEIPPDLTSPSYENSFRLSEFVKGVDANTISLSDEENTELETKKVLEPPTNIEVKKLGTRRWLVVDKKPELVWNLSKQFLKEKGFVIKKSNKKIGVMETDFLENKPPQIPGESMGFMRSMLQASVENINYTLPTVDKYKIRIEPLEVESSIKTEVHLSLSSMAEVITGSGGNNESTLWQETERDVNLENEMLYELMLFLGSDTALAREKILSAEDQDKILVSLENGLNGYQKLVFSLNMQDTWDSMNWALTSLNVDLEDRDVKEKTFYVRYIDDESLGIMSRLLGKDAILASYQIQLKEISSKVTEVYFFDITEQNNIETKRINKDLFGKIKNSF